MERGGEVMVLQLLARVRGHLQRAGGEEEEREDKKDVGKADAIEGRRETYHGKGNSSIKAKVFQRRAAAAGEDALQGQGICYFCALKSEPDSVLIPRTKNRSLIARPLHLH